MPMSTAPLLRSSASVRSPSSELRPTWSPLGGCLHVARTPAAVMLLCLMLLATACAPAATPGGGPSQTGQSSVGRQATTQKRIVAGIPSNPPMLYNKLNVGGVGGQGSALQDLVHVGMSM